MTRPAHTIMLQPWSHTSTGVRLVCEATSIMMWPLQSDDRLTALISLMAKEIDTVAESEEQIDAVVEIVRMHLKMQRRWND